MTLKQRQTSRFLWLCKQYPLNRIRNAQWADIWGTSRTYVSRVVRQTENTNGKPTMLSDKAMISTCDYLNEHHGEYFNYKITVKWFTASVFDESIYRKTIEVRSQDTVKLRHSSVRKLCDMVIKLKGKDSFRMFFVKLGYSINTAGKMGSDLQKHDPEFPVLPVLYRIDKRYKVNVWFVLMGVGEVKRL